MPQSDKQTRWVRAEGMWQIVSSIVVLAAPFLILLYDVLAYRLGGPDATITAAVQWFASKWPELPSFMAAVFVWLWLHLFMTGLMDRVNKRNPPVEPPAIKNGKNGKG